MKSERFWEEFPVLHTERLSLIQIQQAHLGDIYALFRDEDVTRFYNLLPLKEEIEAQRAIDWFESRYRDRLGVRWGISLKGKGNIIGTLGFNNFMPHHKANIGYDLQKIYWGQGYVSEALAAILTFGFEELGVNRIEAEVMQGNFASEKVLEKLKFKREGVLREWMYWNERHYDMTMFSLLKAEFVSV